MDLVQGTAATTAAGLVTEKIGHVPVIGEKVQISARVEAEVLEATPRHVVKLRLYFVAHDDSEPDDASL